MNNLHLLKLNDSRWIAIYFSTITNIKRFCFTLGKGKIILFYRHIHFHIYIQKRQKKKKKEKKWDSCFINLLSPHSFIVLIMTPSMSPFIFQKPVTFLFDCSFILRFDFAKNYKWSSQKKFIAPREYYFIWDWNTN